MGLRAHPVESGQQPEASLASLQVTVRAKRRQRVFRAGPFSPEIGLFAGAPAVRASGGRACSPVSAWEGGPAGVSEVGAATLGLPRNLGDLFVSSVTLPSAWVSRAVSAPGLGGRIRTTGERNGGCTHGGIVRRAKRVGRDG